MFSTPDDNIIIFVFSAQQSISVTKHRVRCAGLPRVAPLALLGQFNKKKKHFTNEFHKHTQIMNTEQLKNVKWRNEYYIPMKIIDANYKNLLIDKRLSFQWSWPLFHFRRVLFTFETIETVSLSFLSSYSFVSTRPVVATGSSPANSVERVSKPH